MWEAVWVMAVFAACAQAQAPRSGEVLLPQPRRIVGVVVDQDGRPVPKAGIYHTGDKWAYESSLQGGFAFDTKAPVFVVRKPGYRSALVRVQSANEVLVTLERLSEARAFPICRKGRRYGEIKGWRTWFRFPRVPGIRATRRGSDVDYGARFYHAGRLERSKEVMHGCGSNWSLGVPSDMDVWRSVAYQENSFEVGGGPCDPMPVAKSPLNDAKASEVGFWAITTDNAYPEVGLSQADLRGAIRQHFLERRLEPVSP